VQSCRHYLRTSGQQRLAGHVALERLKAGNCCDIPITLFTPAIAGQCVLVLCRCVMMRQTTTRLLDFFIGTTVGQTVFGESRKGLKAMVELTGIEPVASSLRTRASLLVTRSNHNPWRNLGPSSWSNNCTRERRYSPKIRRSITSGSVVLSSHGPAAHP